MTKHTLATMYGTGLARFAPGTAGSFVAMLLAGPILLLPFGWAWLTLGTIVFTALGTRSATRYMRDHDCGHDPSEIVIDELVGQWLTYALMFLYYASQGVVLATPFDGEPFLLCTHLVVGFFLFRLFDIMKPWPISWADRKIGGGFGVMFDDLLAAIPAALVLFIADAYLSPLRWF